MGWTALGACLIAGFGMVWIESIVPGNVLMYIFQNISDEKSHIISVSNVYSFARIIVHAFLTL